MIYALKFSNSMRIELKSIVKVDEVPELQYETLVRQAAEECGADAIIIEDD